MKKLWLDIKFWCEHNLTVCKWKLVKTALTGHPFDSEYLMDLEKAKLQEMLAYFQISNIVDHRNNIKWIKMCIKLIDIIENDGVWESEPTYVNINNFYRFVKVRYDIPMESVKEYQIKYPQDLRYSKALHLYYEIRKNYTYNWWD